MGIERTNRADDPRVAAFHGLRDGDLLRSRGLFVAEGRLVVRRVLADSRYRVQSVLVNDAALRDLEQAMAALDAAVPIFVCTADQLAGVAGYDVHRGCLALVHRPPPETVDAVAAASTTLVVLEGVANADNVGGVFRNAAAFGVDGVLLSPACCDPLYRKAIRTSMAAVLRVPFARASADDWPGALARVKAAGFTIVALTPHEPSETLRQFASRPRAPRLALMVGTEGAGLTPEAEAAADHRVRIPIAGGIDSLNLTVATGIALYSCLNGEGYRDHKATKNTKIHKEDLF
jgi:tRNA G18 (ribose-2'-O)-methylase SpoU